MIRFRVLVAEDEPHARSMVVGLLGRDAEVEVVANCADGRAAADAMSHKGIDIAFLDIEMPESSGLQIAERAAADGPSSSSSRPSAGMRRQPSTSARWTTC